MPLHFLSHRMLIYTYTFSYTFLTLHREKESYS
jgi:hypothetical protein